MPFPELNDKYRSIASNYVEILKSIGKDDWDNSETSWDFRASPLLNDKHFNNLLYETYKSFRKFWSMHSPGPGLSCAARSHGKAGILFDLLDAERNAGVRLTENFAMYPAASVSGFYFSHPESRYFAVGKIGRDQVLDYQRRKGMDLSTVERWLGPNLNYDPEK